MMKLLWVLMIAGTITSCKTSNTFFSKKNFHAEYGKRLISAGLHQSAMGRNWFEVAENALLKPITIQLPYKTKGYFAADRPRAAGLQFSVKRGQKIIIELDKNPRNNFDLYTDVWQAERQKHILIYSFDTLQTKYEYEVEKDVTLILRIQPELLQSGDYELSIVTGPSLKFPVSGKSARVGSFWGAARDAGARSHEGIDIFAPKRTPVIAAAKGKVTSVGENKLGGKVVWLRPDKKDYTLYYAHLDEQLVRMGGEINEGDTIGLVGNTGNALNTTHHLHFGIYTSGGAIDPLPFVNQEIKKPDNITISITQVQKLFRLSRAMELTFSNGFKTTFPIYTIVTPMAVTSKEMIVELPDKQITILPLAATQVVSVTLKERKLNGQAILFDHPLLSAAHKKIINSGSAISILGYFGSFSYVKTEENLFGWISTNGNF